jgi:hypothetical protein
LAGGWIRNGYLWNTTKGDLVDKRFLQMRADLGAQVKFGPFRASGTLGVNSKESAALSLKSWVTSNPNGWNLVSREHWLGVDLADDRVLLRAGRINVPFGLRNPEHTAWVRSETRTDYNQGQQHGVAASWNGSDVRAEVMAILGNYQIHPDAFRERGYSGYAEFALSKRAAAGLSSLVTYTDDDYIVSSAAWRQAHGAFARYAPDKRLVLLAEVDGLISSVKGTGTGSGWTGLLQGDLEVVQGLHLLGTLEALRKPAAGAAKSYGGWAGVEWFPLPHLDVRFDTIVHRLGGASGSAGTTSVSYVAQCQVYL